MAEWFKAAVLKFGSRYLGSSRRIPYGPENSAISGSRIVLCPISSLGVG